MHIFDEIVKLQGPVKYSKTYSGNLQMVGYDNPLSIKEKEFEFLRYLIIDNNFKSGFEVATAFGISGLAAALGFKETGGKLVTMDAYIEEQHNDAGTYFASDPTVYLNAKGWKSANFLASTFDVVENMIIKPGWSPIQVAEIITSVHGSTPLDYAFIDAGHISEWVLRDFDAVLPFMAKRGVIVFHDIYPDVFSPSVVDRIETMGHNKIQISVPYPYGENLGYIHLNL